MTTLTNTREVITPVANHHRYGRLYRAVILRAVHDLTQQKHRDEARKWLLSSDSDYAFATAGISAQSIRQHVI